jgi:hypothetical protein
MFVTIQDFTSDHFTATQWEGADRKARLARQFIKFVQSDFAKAQFGNAFYARLALTFGHIAHYDLHGFYAEFFTTTNDKLRFLRQTLQHQCVGDPAFTYSDVEKALQRWLQQNRVLEKYEHILAEENRAAEKAEVLHIQAKPE